jgi:hypothetical protein
MLLVGYASLIFNGAAETTTHERRKIANSHRLALHCFILVFFPF